MTKHHADNTNGSEGWKTNDNYVVNEKLIFPWGCQYEKLFGFSQRWGGTIDFYNDLDRVLAVLDGRDFESIITIGTALSWAFDCIKNRPPEQMPQASRDLAFQKRARSRYFDIKFFQKGTVHLQFVNRELWAKFNQAATAGKRWLGSNTNGRSEWPGRRARAGAA